MASTLFASIGSIGGVSTPHRIVTATPVTNAHHDGHDAHLASGGSGLDDLVVPVVPSWSTALGTKPSSSHLMMGW
jgi:hypothetical protein